LSDLTRDDLDRIVTAALRGQVAAGVTTVRDLGDRDWFVAERRAARDGLPRVLASGPPITVTDGHCANMGGAVAGAPGTRVPALRTAVEARAERGVDVVKIMASGGVMTAGTDPVAAQFELTELRAVVEAAHGYGLPVTAHAHALDAVRSAIDAGVDGIEHCSCMTGHGPSLSADLLADLAAARIAVCPTGGRVGLELPARTKAVMERFNLTLETFTRHFGALHEAGVWLVAGDDSGISPDKPHGIMPAAVADLVTYGLSVTQALAAATGSGAEAIGLGQVTGRLRPGMAADLLIVDGDLRRGVDALTRPVTVVVRGTSRTDGPE
jgi:imidazolonepropionase-like amidohydrolase